jgi:hypothetical protein
MLASLNDKAADRSVQYDSRVVMAGYGSPVVERADAALTPTPAPFEVIMVPVLRNVPRSPATPSAASVSVVTDPAFSNLPDHR